ncbi:MAG: redoxin domain-containing protein [Asticcacaulis sp.]
MKITQIALAFGIAAITFAAAAPAFAALKVGDPAPDFQLQAANNGKVSTFSLKGRAEKGPVVVYFYPKAFTGGCSLEAHDSPKPCRNSRRSTCPVIGRLGRRHRHPEEVLHPDLRRQVPGRGRSRPGRRHPVRRQDGRRHHGQTASPMSSARTARSPSSMKTATPRPTCRRCSMPSARPASDLAGITKSKLPPAPPLAFPCLFTYRPPSFRVSARIVRCSDPSCLRVFRSMARHPG